MKAIITDIQRFSLHDGPGIRTTVFFKGCNLRCAWCHNPETLTAPAQEAFYPAKCIHCGHCETGCPTGARTTIGREVTVGDVLNAVLPDKPYYDASQGGITLSGGEPLMHADFAAELLKACREAGIKTAIETNLSFPWDQIEKLVPWLDEIYFDIKLFDSAEHEKWTGSGNERILDNARRLSETGVPMIVRTPLIPGATDSDENVAAIAAFVSKLPHVRYYELLNYNVLAKAKYEPVGLTYALDNAQPLPQNRLEALRKLACQQGVACRVSRG